VTRRDETGATAVEFALVVPLFFVLLGITGYFAWQLYVQSQLDRAAQAAARFAAVPTTDGTYAYRHCDIVADVNSNLAATSVPDDGVAVRDAAGPLAPATCPGGPAATAPTGYVHVRLTRTLDNPFSDVLTFLMQRPKPLVITGSGDARVEDTR
jgi:Flp pilus assembly protein TadG